MTNEERDVLEMESVVMGVREGRMPWDRARFSDAERADIKSRRAEIRAALGLKGLGG